MGRHIEQWNGTGAPSVPAVQKRQRLIAEVESLVMRLTVEERLDLVNRVFAKLADATVDPLLLADSMPSYEVQEIPICRPEERVNVDMDVVSAKYRALLQRDPQEDDLDGFLTRD